MKTNQKAPQDKKTPMDATTTKANKNNLSTTDVDNDYDDDSELTTKNRSTNGKSKTAEKTTTEKGKSTSKR